ncbi:hypothetical protein B566_EDAN002213, partial [Ephemera danica]
MYFSVVLPPSWESASGGNLPAGAVAGGNTRNGTCYIARVKDNSGQWVPAVFIPKEKACFSIARSGRFLAEQYQVSMDDECCYLFKKRTMKCEAYVEYEVLTLSLKELEELKKQDNPPGFLASLSPWRSGNGYKPPAPTVPIPTPAHNVGNKSKKGRCSHQGEWLPGKFIPKLRCCIVGYKGEEVKKYTYEILCHCKPKWVRVVVNTSLQLPMKSLPVFQSNKNDGEKSYFGRVLFDEHVTLGEVLCNVQAEWIPMNAGQQYVPEKAILGGITHISEPLYIGRVLDKSSVGKVLDGACLAVYGNKEHTHRNFEILVTSSNANALKSKSYNSNDPPNLLTMNTKHIDEQPNTRKMTGAKYAPTSTTSADEEYEFPPTPPHMNDGRAINFSEPRNTTSGHRPNLTKHNQPMFSSKGVPTSGEQFKHSYETQHVHDRNVISTKHTEPEDTSVVRRRRTDDAQTLMEMKQTQSLNSSKSRVSTSSSSSSFENRDTFKANPQMRSQPEMDEIANSIYERSQEKPEIFERHRSGQGASLPPSTEYYPPDETENSSCKTHDNNWERARTGHNIPQNAFIAGSDFNGNPIYIARAKHGLCLLVGGLTNLGPFRTYYNKIVYDNEDYQVFCNQNVFWQKMRNGDKIPSNAVPCGYTDEEQNIFVGRVPYEQKAMLIAPVYEMSPQCILVIEDKELQCPTFEIMVTREGNVETIQEPPIGVQTVNRNFDQMAISHNNSNQALNSSGAETALNGHVRVVDTTRSSVFQQTHQVTQPTQVAHSRQVTQPTQVAQSTQVTHQY